MAKRKRRQAQHNPPASSYIGYALLGVGAYMLFKKWKGMGATPDAAKAAIERAVGPMVAPAPTIPGSPTNVVGWWRNYKPAQQMPAPGDFSPVTGEQVQSASLPPITMDQIMRMSPEQVIAEANARKPQTPQSLSASLMSAASATGVGRPVSTTQIVMASRSPDPAQLDPDFQRTVETEQNFKKSLGSDFQRSIGAKQVRPDFLSAYQEKQIKLLPPEQQAAARNSKYLTLTPVKLGADGSPVAVAPEAIAAAFYAKKDAFNADPALIKQRDGIANEISTAQMAKRTALENRDGKALAKASAEIAALDLKLGSVNNRLAAQSGTELKKYQDSYVEQSRLQQQLEADPSNKRIQNKLASVSAKLEKMDAQAQTGYRQAVEIKQLDAKQTDDKRQLSRIAAEKGYVNQSGSMTISDPVLAAAVADMNLKHSVERQRLKERQTGVSTTTDAKREEWKKATPEAQAEGLRRDIATELVKQATNTKDGGYKPLPGESFEDAVKKELATGNIGKDAGMKAAAEAKVQKMRDDAAKSQQQAAKDLQDSLAKARAMTPLAPPTPIGPQAPRFKPGRGKPLVMITGARQKSEATGPAPESGSPSSSEPISSGSDSSGRAVGPNVSGRVSASNTRLTDVMASNPPQRGSAQSIPQSAAERTSAASDLLTSVMDRPTSVSKIKAPAYETE